ncbi:DivIVA domain-containing protein [Microcella daejeonensis]|uniref:Cell wall synthesis protein Wag31 n=1 Tax=Microcella daejeonensis TaxID=2994971 RepID=A0A9E8MKN8_9MICO|nr:DivIVA domain-containing protein [Microcella daejeonensis]WAB81355.1 DivIVA domain-containing protein [Microcella daejeonensis]WAB83523.1 DivIVA domain-containing protein [Microcella daejeonensis]
MALTPEDVVNKRFQSTKFREGYDQDEVDDFLDEIVVELRRLNQENEELRQRLVAADARMAEQQRSGALPASAPASAPAPTPVVAEAPAPAPAPAPAVPSAPAVEAPAYGQTSSELETTSTNNLLQLARRLHEEHVREGIAKRDELIAEGEAHAARIVSEAEGKQREIVDALNAERATLETRVEELRVFEREYRAQLRTYIQGQLRELETSSQTSAAPAAPVGSAASASSAAAPASAPAPGYGFPGSAPSFGQPQQTPGTFPGYGS